MQFGIFDHLDDSGVPLTEHFENRLRLMEAYDRGGFRSYHMAEHHGTPLGFAPSPAVFLSAAAQRTRRLRFGPLVFLLPLYHPLRLIEEICMLDQMSGGRLELGIGRGASPIEVGLFGVESSEAMARYQETLEIVLQGLRCDELTYNGKFYWLDRVPMVMKPVQRPHPPLWYGISNPGTSVWAAANNVNVIGLLPAPVLRRINDRYRAEWGRLGKAEAELPFLGASRHMVLAETDADARAAACHAYPAWRTNMERLWKQRGVPFPLDLPNAFDDYQRAGFGFAGTAAGARDYIREQVATARINYLVCGVAFGTLPLGAALRTADLLAREVIPAFAEDTRVTDAG
ncbi:MAG TPA: LLM class flavin-dependent oxidoreductase [Bryobacteraceae bacterium]|nr:LLM class flavin-dependent oxidoreductase [Bryobacteraceae bacterium]